MTTWPHIIVCEKPRIIPEILKYQPKRGKKESCIPLKAKTCTNEIFQKETHLEGNKLGFKKPVELQQVASPITLWNKHFTLFSKLQSFQFINSEQGKHIMMPTLLTM
uniref:Uncharacterized protein n=1 Tax=Rhizophora mucronata TaxID=61149 RepID=A0A2P2QTA0_RHIMU